MDKIERFFGKLSEAELRRIKMGLEIREMLLNIEKSHLELEGVEFDYGKHFPHVDKQLFRSGGYDYSLHDIGTMQALQMANEVEKIALKVKSQIQFPEYKDSKPLK